MCYDTHRQRNTQTRKKDQEMRPAWAPYRRAGLRLRVHCLRGLRVHQCGWSCILSWGIWSLPGNKKSKVSGSNYSSKKTGTEHVISWSVWHGDKGEKIAMEKLSRTDPSTLPLLVAACSSNSRSTSKQQMHYSLLVRVYYHFIGQFAPIYHLSSPSTAVENNPRDTCPNRVSPKPCVSKGLATCFQKPSLNQFPRKARTVDNANKSSKIRQTARNNLECV